jgi:hypothetical protein
MNWAPLQTQLNELINEFETLSLVQATTGKAELLFFRLKLRKEVIYIIKEPI